MCSIESMYKLFELIRRRYDRVGDAVNIDIDLMGAASHRTVVGQ